MSEFDFEVVEYETRLASAQKLMQRERFDAILITSEDHFRYFTGFNSPTWANLTRPRYAVLPSQGDIVLVIPTSNTEIARRTSWVRDVRTWISPQPEDDGISLVRDAIRSVPSRYGRVGAELGAESRLTMPVGDFLRLGREISSSEFVDAYPLLRELLIRKSPAEVEKMRAIGQIASSAYEALPQNLHAGMSVREACSVFRRELLERGAETSPYVIGVAERHGYPCFNLEPSERRIGEGDVLVIDTGSTRHGYFCDFNREFSFGPLHEKLRLIYDIVWNATEVGIKATEPGRTLGDIWQQMSTSMQKASEAIGLPFEPFALGRMGHGLGLRMCETPSIAPGVNTIVEPGMVLTIEPSMAYRIDVGGETRIHVCVHEENVAVTTNQASLLNRRAPREMPTVG